MNIIRKKNNSTEFDEIDTEIINLLQKNARLSNKEMAAILGIAQSTCSERIRKLNERKVFKGYHAYVDAHQLGANIQAIVSIKLTKHSKNLVADFKKSLVNHQEVINSYHMASESDFLLHIAVRDTQHLRDFVMDKLTSQEIVLYANSSLIYEYRNNPLFPIY